MRIVLSIGVVLGGLLLASCSSTSAFVADSLPEWAGGLPEGTPPRYGAPGYRAYVKALSGDQPASATEPAAAPQSRLPKSLPTQSPPPPPRIDREPIDEPIH